MNPNQEEHLTTPTEGIDALAPHGVIRGLVIMAVAAIVSLLVYNVLPYEENANKGIAFVLFVGILWLTEAVHITLTALMIPLLAVALKMPDTNMTKALAGFANPIIFLFLGGFALATALHVQKIDRKIANGIIKAAGSNMFTAVIALAAVTAFLSMWISNTATAVMMLPLALGMMDSLDKDDKRTRAFIMLVIAYSANIGGMGTLVGSPPNAIAAAALDISFTDWLPYGLPMMLVLMPVMFVTMYFIFRPKLGKIKQEVAAEVIPWTPRRKLTIVVFLITALAWIFGDFLKDLGISSPDTFVALAAIVAVVTLGLANWGQVSDNTDWGVLLLFGGGITLSTLMQSSGASMAMGNQIATTFGTAHPLVIILVVTAFIVFLTEFTSNTASAALLVPVFGTIGVQLGLPEQVLVMVIALGASCAFMLPVATPPNAVVFGTGLVTQRDMFKAGLVLNILCIAIVALFAHFLWEVL